MRSRIRIALAPGSLVGYPEGGGLWCYFLQHLLALNSLGPDLLWLELFRSSGSGTRDQTLIRVFFQRMRDYGLEGNCAVLLIDKDTDAPTLEAAQVYGRSAEGIQEFARSADVLWNYAVAFRQPLLSLFRRRALVDLEPGHLQVSALNWDMGQHDHDVFLTVGSKMGDEDCEVPTLGLKWHPFLPCVYSPLWRSQPDPGPTAPFTSVTQWNWEELWLAGRVLSIAKRPAYLRYLELPRITARHFELAVNIHPEDQTGDRELVA